MGMEDNVNPAEDIDAPFINRYLGEFEVRLGETIKRTSNKTKREFIKALVEVTKSSSVDLPEGATATIFIREDEWDYYKEDLAALAAALTKKPITQYKPQVIKDLTSDAQPFLGTTFKVINYQGMDKHGQPKVRKDGAPMVFSRFEALQ